MGKQRTMGGDKPAAKEGSKSKTAPRKASNKDLKKLQTAQVQKYINGPVKFNTRNISEKARRRTLQETDDQLQQAAIKAAETEILLPAEDGFLEVDKHQKVFSLKQKEIAANVDINTAKNLLDLQLHDFGPYGVKYSASGRHLLFCGRKGHVAAMDCHRTVVSTEIQLEQEVLDIQPLHNETLFAVAQQRYTYIYDNKGTEIHCMKRHERPYRLDFLPYHFLLTTIGHSGWIKWHDISIGEYVAGYGTGFGPCKVLKHNPVNAVSHVGHSNGVVSLWSPTQGKSLVSLFCHKAPVTDLAVDRQGNYMVTAGLDGLMKVWDLRKYVEMHSYRLDQPAVSIDISDRGLVGVAMGRKAQVLRNVFTHNPREVTYLTHELRTPNAALSSGGGAVAAAKSLLSSVKAHQVKFRPFEDLLCIGHSHGISTMIVPGAGEANFDTFENNPFSNLRQRREAEVQKLMTKLSHETIGIDSSFVGAIEKDQEQLAREHKELFSAANPKQKTQQEKNRKRGRNKISAKLRRRQKNVIDAQLLKLKEKQASDRQKHVTAAAVKGPSQNAQEPQLGALSRFAKKQTQS